jgi:excinuclease ABC subunit C
MAGQQPALTMHGLFASKLFTGFGPSRFRPPVLVTVSGHVQARRLVKLRAGVRISCTNAPGIYGMLDARGGLIYIGKAKRLRSRLLSYFRPRGRDPKAGRILQHTRTIIWEEAAGEFAALLRELELIQRWLPRFNLHGRPSLRRRYIRLGGRRAAGLFLSRKPTAKGCFHYGPVPGGRSVREAIRRLNDWFRLRDCPQTQPMRFADQAELFPVLRTPGCLRYEIGTCLGPCIAACGSTDYAARVAAARAFLEGASDEPIQKLEQQMQRASSQLDFEHAAVLRDRIKHLRWLRERLDYVQTARRQHSFIYPIEEPDKRALWYLIHRGQVADVLCVALDDGNHASFVERIERLYRSPEVSTGSAPETVFLVASWFRRYARERERILTPEKALSLLGRVGR